MRCTCYMINLKETAMKNIDLTSNLIDFTKDADLEQIGIGCSGDSVIKITKNDNVYFLKYSANPTIQIEYEKLKWLQGKLPVPKIVSYEEKDGKYYLLTHKLDGEMVCTPFYMKNWQIGLNVIQQAFSVLWDIDISDCPFDAGIDYKLNQIKNKLDNNLINPEDIRPEFLEKHNGIHGMYKYLVDNRPSEKLVFSHGDTSLPNIFGTGDKLTGFIDVADCGAADIWFDIAVTAKSVQRNYGKEALDVFYNQIKNQIGEIDFDAIEYYVTLVEF